jgi:hypothetical protein
MPRYSSYKLPNTMKTHIYFAMLIVLCAVSVNSFAQDTSPAKQQEEDERSDEARQRGLRRVARGDGEVQMEMEMNIQVEEEIEHSVETVMEAMQEIEANMSEIEVNFAIEIPEAVEVEIEPIFIDTDDFEPIFEEESEKTK